MDEDGQCTYAQRYIDVVDQWTGLDIKNHGVSERHGELSCYRSKKYGKHPNTLIVVDFTIVVCVDCMDLPYLPNYTAESSRFVTTNLFDLYLFAKLYSC